MNSIEMETHSVAEDVRRAKEIIKSEIIQNIIQQNIDFWKNLDISSKDVRLFFRNGLDGEAQLIAEFKAGDKKIIDQKAFDPAYWAHFMLHFNSISGEIVKKFNLDINWGLKMEVFNYLNVELIEKIKSLEMKVAIKRIRSAIREALRDKKRVQEARIQFKHWTDRRLKSRAFKLIRKALSAGFEDYDEEEATQIFKAAWDEYLVKRTLGK